MDYIKGVKTTENKDFGSMSSRLQDQELVRLLHAGMGMSTEANEFLDTLKKTIFYGKPLDKVNLIEELSDQMWYIAVALDQLGSSFEEAQKLNLKKLRTRYEKGFTQEAACNRDLSAELTALSSGGLDGDS